MAKVSAASATLMTSLEEIGRRAGGGPEVSSPVRVLVVEDFEPFRRFLCTRLRERPGLQLVGEVSDGVNAVRLVEAIQTDLILLDVSLPAMNGLEVARQICQISPSSKILFVTENRSTDIAREALSAGASGYLVKSDSANELLPAIEAVLQGKRYVSPSLKMRDGCPIDEPAPVERLV